MNIGVVSTLFPTRHNPTAGIFVSEELAYLSRHVNLKLMAPFPNQRWFTGNLQGWDRPLYPVKRPFVLAFPRFFMQHRYPASMRLMLKLRGRSFFADSDIIHAHNAFPEGVASVGAFADRYPVIITVHGSDINYFAMKPSLQPDIVKALNRAAHIICVSTSLKKTVESLGVGTPKTVINNGIATAEFRPQDKTESCRSLGLDPARPRLLFAGNFVPVKGIIYLLQAFPEVLKHCGDCELILLGARKGKRDRDRYANEIEETGIAHALKIVERVQHSEFSAWIHASDVIVLPSIHEGFGLVAAEALSCGRPVVSTKSGGPEDIVTEGLGYLVEPRNPDALADAIVKTLNGEGIADADTLSRSIRERFDYEVVTDKILDVYRDVLGIQKNKSSV